MAKGDSTGGGAAQGGAISAGPGTNYNEFNPANGNFNQFQAGNYDLGNNRHMSVSGPSGGMGGGMMGRIGQGMGQIGQGMGRMGGIGYGGSTPPPQGQGGFMGNLSRMGAQMNAPQGGGTMQGSIGGMPRQGNPMFEGMDPQVARLFQMYSQSQRPQY